MKTIISGLTAILGLSNLYAAAPTLSSASMSNGTVRISGSNFGVKAVAAPYKFQPFTTTTNGQTYSQVGFDFVSGNNSVAARNRVEMSDGIGGGSWLHTTPGGGHESFSHFGYLLPPGTNSVFASYWVRLKRITAGGTGNAQVKGIRAGMQRSSDPISGMYRSNPSYDFSLHIKVDSIEDRTGPNSGATNAAGVQSMYYPEGRYDVPLLKGNWHHVEIFYRLNTLGRADGVQMVRIDGTQHVDLSNRQPRTNAGESLGYIQPSPGLANAFSAAIWEARYSRIYVDTTRARVFLGNAATLAACTKRFLLAPTAWSDNSITLGSVVNVPTGFNWIYVSNHGGEINAAGYNLAGSTTGNLPGKPICRNCKSEGILSNVYNVRGQVLSNRESRLNADTRPFPESFRNK